MKTNEIIIAIVVALVFYFRPLDSKPTCPPGWYYDAVVGRCSPCTDICLNAAIQRTEKECRRKCPNFEAAGTDKVNNVYEDHKPEAVAIVIFIIGVIVIVTIVASIILVWKNRKDVKMFIGKWTGRDRDLEEVEQDEAAAKELFLDGPVQRYCNNGKPRDDSGGAKRDNIEMISIVPPSDDNSFAHVSEEDDEETVAKELFLGPVHVLGNNGNLGDSSGGANSDSIEMISIVPPSDDNNFAQVSDTNCGKYIPTIGRRWAII